MSLLTGLGANDLKTIIGIPAVLIGIGVLIGLGIGYWWWG